MNTVMPPQLVTSGSGKVTPVELSRSLAGAVAKEGGEDLKAVREYCETVAKASGVNDNQPHSPTTFTASGLNLTYRSGVATTFGLSVDAGTSVGNATQVRVSYDLTGDGTFDRVETFRYFATDPVTGWERYTDGVGQVTTTGSFGNLANGTVKLVIWSAIGSAPSSVSLGALSTVTLPYN